MTFKAKLLLADAQNDPIKRSEVIKSLVESISLMPDSIKRSVYIKECARMMDIDENVLVGEVARKRLMSTGDKEAEAFVRRATQRHRAEQGATQVVSRVDDAPFGNISAGSSEDALEREIIYYLLVHGNKNFELKEGRNYVPINVATLIVDEMALDKMSLNNGVYNKIFDIFRVASEQGRYPDPREYVAHHDPEVCNVAIDILTQNDVYVESEIWSKKEVHTISEQEVLSVGVPKVMKLFKTKRLTKMIADLQAELRREGISEDEQLAIMSQIDKLNRAKVVLTKSLNRLII
jgi:DNA primase